MKKASIAVVIAGLTGLLLISGCGGGDRRGNQSPNAGQATTAPASADAVAGSAAGGGAGATGVDEPLKEVDDLINQLDDQVNSDNRAARDSD